MKHMLLLVIFLSFFGIVNNFVEANPSDPKSQSKSLESIFKKGGISLNDLGIYVAGPNGIVYENNAEKKFVPASLSKILTGIAAFKVFAPEERNITELRSVGSLNETYLDGPLYIQGHGDPSLISENMWVLVNNLARTGIKKIKGPIRVDGSIFDENYFDDSRKDRRVSRAYDAPVAGVSFNWNTANVYVSPSKVGQPLRVQVDPPSDYFKVINKTTTVKGSKFPAIIIDKQKNKDGETLLVSGSMGANRPEAVKYVNVTYPHLWTAKNLISFLKQRDIVVENEDVEITKVPSKSQLLSEVKGWTYYALIDGMMKYSNNFLAEALTKNIVVKRTGKQGNIGTGVDLIKEILETNYGLKRTSYDFVSPSGFSNDNKISPQDLGLLMTRAKADFAISSYLLSTMAVPNHEGTLSSRMKSLKESRLIRAKTGLLSGVVGLAGYAANSKGEVYTFVFVYNGKGKESNARDLFDRAAMNITSL